MRPHYTWKLRTRTLNLGPRTLIMGIVNVTPDSFYDGGRFASPDQAVAHALALLDDGAEILDIGGESTRPGKHEPVTETMEMERVLPVIRGILRARPEAVVSVDTYRSGVARAAMEAGAEIVNDVSGFQWDSNMAETVAEVGCGAVLMHMRGRPEQWRSLPPARNIVELVCGELAYYASVAIKFGVPRECLALDPGFGFGKNFDENYPLLARFDALHQLRFPLLAGTSRKSFIGRTLARSGSEELVPVEDRLYGTVATVTAAILKGAHIVRVHDVKPAADAAKIADAILAAEER